MSAYDTILDALDAAGMKTYAHPNQARSQCPAHQSSGLTLSVRRGDDRARLKCFAGCDAAEVLEAIGLALRDLFDEPVAPRSGYLPPRRVRTPWEEAMASIGIHNPPPLEHVLDRMAYEAKKTGGAA